MEHNFISLWRKILAIPAILLGLLHVPIYIFKLPIISLGDVLHAIANLAAAIILFYVGQRWLRGTQA